MEILENPFRDEYSLNIIKGRQKEINNILKMDFFRGQNSFVELLSKNKVYEAKQFLEKIEACFNLFVQTDEEIQELNKFFLKHIFENPIEEKNLTPLMASAHLSDAEIFFYLINKGADIHKKDSYGNSVLFHALNSQNQSIIKYLIGNGLDLNEKNKKGITPFLSAAQKCSKEFFDFFIKKGGNITDTDNNGRNILHFACLNKDKRLLNYIIEELKFPINSKDKNGVTPLMLVASTGNFDMFNFLLEKLDKEHLKKYLRSEDNMRKNLLFYAAAGGNKYITKYLLDEGLDKNAISTNGENLILQTAKSSNIRMLSSFIKYGLNLKQEDKDGNDLLAYAVLNDADQNFITFLVKKYGFNLEKRYKNSDTLLMIAARNERYKNIQVLVALKKLQLKSLGCRDEDLLISLSNYINAVNDENLNAMQIAVIHGSLNSIKELSMTAGSSLNSYYEEYKNENNKTIKSEILSPVVLAMMLKNRSALTAMLKYNTNFDYTRKVIGSYRKFLSPQERITVPDVAALKINKPATIFDIALLYNRENEFKTLVYLIGKSNYRNLDGLKKLKSSLVDSLMFYDKNRTLIGDRKSIVNLYNVRINEFSEVIKKLETEKTERKKEMERRERQNNQNVRHL